MKITDHIDKVHGHITFEVLDINDNVIDVYDSKNMIMSAARNTLMNDVAGFNNRTINKFIMGVDGHKTGDLLTPKTATDGFVDTRTNLFAEANSLYTYAINFTPTTAGNNATINSTTDGAAGSIINISTTTTSVTYVIEISAAAANNNSQVAYTEAALYAGNNIFAMRCFPVRVKDSTTKFRITWTLSF